MATTLHGADFTHDSVELQKVDLDLQAALEFTGGPAVTSFTSWRVGLGTSPKTKTNSRTDFPAQKQRHVKNKSRL